MPSEVYRELCRTMQKRGGMYPGLDIPKFYALMETLFTPEEAAASNALGRGFNTAAQTAEAMNRPEDEVAALLEGMADKGLVTAGEMDGTMYYAGPPLAPGVFEYQFMGGAVGPRAEKIARLIYDYKEAYNRAVGGRSEPFPLSRVITVDRHVAAGNQVHTYDQVASYIEKYEPLAVATCFCRHEGRLLDHEPCDAPDDVCMMFGPGAQFLIDRKIGRRITREEAMDVLRRSEEAGLVHCSANRQEIDFLCNCCSCHCMILSEALKQPKPGLAVFSGYLPEWDSGLCTACETCLERCPAQALSMAGDSVVLDADRCFGCGVCATGCPSEAISMRPKPDRAEPPTDRKALKNAIKQAAG